MVHRHALKTLSRFVSLFVILATLAACGGADSTAAPAAQPTTATGADATAAPVADATAAPVADATAAPAATDVPASADAVTINMWLMPNGANPADIVQTEIDAFEAANPNINVEAEVVDWGAAFLKIQTAVQGGEGPCVTQVGTTWNPTFGAMGGLRPYSADEVTAMGGAESFIDASWETTSIIGQPEVYSVPWFADVRSIAYRKDLLDAAGLKPEDAFKDWASYEATLKTIQDKNPGVAGLAFPGRNDWNVWQNSSMWIWAAGGELLTDDNAQAAFNSEESIAGVTQFASLYGKGLTISNTLELNSAQVDAAFGEGRVFSVISGPWLISNSRTPEADGGWANRTVAEGLAYALFPAGPGGRYTFVGGSNLAILKSCPNPEEAVALVKYLTSNESQLRYAPGIGMLPATKTAQADPKVATDPHFKVFIEAAKSGKTSASIAEWGQLESVLNEQIGILWDDVAQTEGVISPDKVKERLDGAAATINDLLGN